MRGSVKRTTYVLILMLASFCLEVNTTSQALAQHGDVRVISDLLPVYSQMSDDSERVATLTKGETVTLNFKIVDSGGAWCDITARGTAPLQGYVRCEHLEGVQSPKSRWRLVAREGHQSTEQTTQVTIVGNLILVPATVGYKGRTTEVLLILDTGASRTVLSTEAAARLRIDLNRARKAMVQVVGGALVEARRETLSFIQVGPHTKTGLEITVIKHQGPSVPYDGLLGIDFLHDLSYHLDYKNKLIRWNPR